MNKVIKVANSFRKRLFKKSYYYLIYRDVYAGITNLFQVLKEEIKSIKKDIYSGLSFDEANRLEKHIYSIERRMLYAFEERDFPYMKSFVKELIFVFNENKEVFGEGAFNFIMSLVNKLNANLDEADEFDPQVPSKPYENL